MPKNDGDYHKHTSHGPEVKAKLSTPSPKRVWHEGSYCPDSGHSVRVGQSPGKHYGQVPSAGRHTTGGPGTASKPGRW